MPDMPRTRVLHILRQLTFGGVESWLSGIVAHLDRDRFQLDVLLHSSDPGALDEQFRSRGVGLFHEQGHRNLPSYARRVRRVMARYDVVHSHVHTYSGLILRWAEQACVPVRIAHSHTCPPPPARGNLPRLAYMEIMRELIRRHATLGLAASRAAADSLIGQDWERDTRWMLFPTAIDLQPFLEPAAVLPAGNELGIPPGREVVFHAGSFRPAKNHRFLLDVFASLLEKRPRAHLVLVGDGPLRLELETRASSLGLAGRVHFLGRRDDVPRLLRGIADLAVFPSQYEGFGLFAVEAQAAGVPVLITDRISRDVVLPGANVVRRSPADAPADWAADAAELLAGGRRGLSDATRDYLETSGINIINSTARLQAIYAAAVAGKPPPTR